MPSRPSTTSHHLPAPERAAASAIRFAPEAEPLLRRRTDPRRLLPWLVLLVSAACPLVAEELVLPNGTERGELPIPAHVRGCVGNLAFRFHDGKAELTTGQPAPITGEWRREGQAVVWRAEGLTVTATVRPGALPVVDLKLLSAPGRWVRVMARAPFAFGTPWRFYDGRSERPGGPGKLEQRLVLGTFPAVAAYDERLGVGLGLDPRCRVSAFAGWADTPNGKHGELALTMPLALAAGRPATLSFVLAGFEPGPFGYRPLIERWHSAFAEAYRPAAGVDPRLGAACAAGAAADEPDATAQADGLDAQGLCQAVLAGWDWCGASDPAARRAQLARVERLGLAPVAGLTTTAGPEADSLIAAEDAPPGELHRFLWGDSLGDALLGEARQLTGELPVAGYALAASGGGRYRPHRPLAGAAYDVRGDYVEEALGGADLLAALHGLRARDGKHRLGTAVRGFGDLHYALASQADAVVADGPVSAALARPDDALRDRLLLGSKPRTWAAPLAEDDLGARVDAAMSPADIRELLRRRWDTLILACFRFGWLPGPDQALGYAPMRRALPVLAECVRAGWHAVPGMTSPGALYLARYGDGLGTRLVVINPSDTQAVTTTVRVLASCLGPTMLYADASGAETLNRLDGVDVVLKVALPPRSWRVFVAVGRHAPGGEAVSVATEPRYDPSARPEPVGVIENHAPGRPRWSFRDAATQAALEQAGLKLAELPEHE